MSSWKRLQSTTALLVTLTLGSATLTPLIAPFVAPMSASAQTNRFQDVSADYWATPFINALVEKGAIAGFPDGTFRPNEPVTRAQFASMVQSVFNSKPVVRQGINFGDVSSNFWAQNAIQDVYRRGFLSGYPGGVFRPNQNIPKEQVLTALANGLNYNTSGSVSQVLDYYNDDAQISNFARSPVAAATEEGLVVNYPNVQSLNPTRNATRAEVAAILYQALVNEGQASSIASRYVVNQSQTPPVASQYRIPTGTTLPISYEKDKILVTEDERLDLTVAVDANITTSNGIVLIPTGSEIRGELVPTNGGTQFVAQQIVFPNGQTQQINAVSPIVTQTETIRKGMNAGEFVQNAAIGTAAAAAISAVTGDNTIATEELLIGGGAGVVFTLIRQFLGRDRVDLLVVDSETDLDLTLRDDLVVSPQQR